MKTFATVLAAIAVFGLAGVAQAEKVREGKAKGKFASLNLTADQKARIKEIRTDARKQIKAVLTDEQLKKVTNAKGQGKDARKAAHKEVKASITADQKAKIRAIHKATKEKIQAVLTADQQNQLKQMHKAREGKAKEGKPGGKKKNQTTSVPAGAGK
ncbi:MAG: Spy/CpxP family protein refolding chaperone [Planctomycetes bacterium]|nr:Spy/CpxP family protein refolding chaperone [Planctomycetota bacterium]